MPQGVYESIFIKISPPVVEFWTNKQTDMAALKRFDVP